MKLRIADSGPGTIVHSIINSNKFDVEISDLWSIRITMILPPAPAESFPTSPNYNYWLATIELVISLAVMVYLCLLIDQFLYLRLIISPAKTYLRYVNPPHQWICPIGRHPPETGQSVVMLPCGHLYIYQYIVNWFKQTARQPSCPLCRRRLILRD